MMDVHHALFTQTNNITTTLNVLFAIRDICPETHLVKLGTMGEYGTPTIDIPEGFFEIEYRGRRDRLPFPRQAGSWYHWSKVHDSNNVMFACQLWGLRATDIMQGVVFGTRIDAMADDSSLFTRLDFDQAFGTVINRFCCQAVINHPLTVYGSGQQQRGFIPLRDSMECLTLALENPPSHGEYRVFNQFEGVHDLLEIALKVQKVAACLGVDVEVSALNNPRCESENHYYNPEQNSLFALGYEPTKDMESELNIMLHDLMKHRERIEAKRDVFLPDVCWDGRRVTMKWVDKHEFNG